MHKGKPVSWLIVGDVYVPTSVDAFCSHCQRPTTLMTSAHQYHPHSKTVVMLGRCPSCEGELKIWAIEPHPKNSASGCKEVWVLADKPTLREPIDFGETLPPRILNAYNSALKCFNSQIWTSTVSECGRALEGITKEKFSNEEQRKRLKHIGENLEKNDSVENILFRPILKLTQAIRLGRNTGAHFDLEKEADREVAQEVLDLTEYMIKYFYVLPSKANDMKTMIEKLGDQGLEEE